MAFETTLACALTTSKPFLDFRLVLGTKYWNWVKEVCVYEESRRRSYVNYTCDGSLGVSLRLSQCYSRDGTLQVFSF